ncbi:hypothetical protein [Limosilactobacillus reuteri]|uniref:hypothetical protein n=1 Tax=Limosilactobacillus reuteri TaxID=1598 RepID=UPI001E4A9BF8|nr:hypothetical protein [Limosilactobacillus reuteri]MCC4466745.1 hypothetical protein [Limosilactobacillus reuteri]MCC4474142.1 hypothetical protein [Limosilactobacillus reuteri]
MNIILEKEITMGEVYKTWLMSMASLNTQRKYQGSVTMFCDMVFGKKPEDITSDDISSIRYRDTITKFVQPLKDKGVKDSTIKAHLTAMRQLVRMMSRNHIYNDSVDYSDLIANVLNVDTLKTNDKEHHETLSEKELDMLKKWFKSKEYRSEDKHLGRKYAMLSSFMYATAIRVTAIFNIKWSDFTVTNSPYGGNWAILKAKDKGQKINEKPIAMVSVRFS